MPYWCERCQGPDCKSLSRYCIHNINTKKYRSLPECVADSESDSFHKMFHHGYIQTELVRPHADGSEPNRTAVESDNTNVYERGTMYAKMTEEDALVAYYYRRVQIQWMVHTCRLDYCKKLKNGKDNGRESSKNRPFV